MEGVGWTEGVQEEGGRERRGENRRNESGEFERRGAKGGEGRNEANGVNLPGCRGSPSPLRPPEGTLLLLLFIFLLRRTGCVSRDKIYPASFPPLRDRVAGGREAMRPTPATRCRLTLSLSLFVSLSLSLIFVYRRRDEAVPVAGVSFSISSNIFPWLLALIQRRSSVGDYRVKYY